MKKLTDSQEHDVKHSTRELEKLGSEVISSCGLQSALDRSVRMAIADIGRTEKVSIVEASARLKTRIREAQSREEVMTRFWFDDGKHLHKPRARRALVSGESPDAKLRRELEEGEQQVVGGQQLAATGGGAGQISAALAQETAR